MGSELLIRGMVCERCVSVIREGLQSLGYPAEKIRLGKITFATGINDEAVSKIQMFLSALGFELISSRDVRLVSQVKCMVEEVFSQEVKKTSRVKFSVMIAEKLAMNYDSISKIFAEQEGITLERFIILQRLQKVKELLSYSAMTLTEIAHLTGYSSIHHLSGQFREITGMTPTAFRSGLQMTHQ